MGCDIHCFVEVRNKETGEWEYLEPDGRWGFYAWASNKEPKRIFNDRNYTLFGVLATVRSEGYDEMSQPRGWPRNCDSKLEEARDDGDLHSHSWFTLKELLEWDVWQHKAYKNDVRWFYAECVAQLMLLGDPSDVRLLFCFDN